MSMRPSYRTYPDFSKSARPQTRFVIPASIAGVTRKPFGPLAFIRPYTGNSTVIEGRKCYKAKSIIRRSALFDFFEPGFRIQTLPMLQAGTGDKMVA